MDKMTQVHHQRSLPSEREHEAHGLSGRLPGARLAYNGMSTQPTYKPHTYVRNAHQEEGKQTYVQNLQNRGGDRPFMQLQHYAPSLPYMQGHYNIRPHDQRLQHGYSQYGQTAQHRQIGQGQGETQYGSRLRHDDNRREQAGQDAVHHSHDHRSAWQADQHQSDSSSNYSI